MIKAQYIGGKVMIESWHVDSLLIAMRVKYGGAQHDREAVDMQTFLDI